jgi:hypothetical protein
MSNDLAKRTTESLIADYQLRISKRWVRCGLGSTRAMQRQDAINKLVDELSRRADDGDDEAARWLDS